MGKLFLGMSGWSYKHWVGPFYPKGLPANRWFSHYTSHFDTVELNVSFYRLPAAATVESWRESSPRNFKFAIKMSRLVTHTHRLLNAEAGLDRFLEMAEGFGPKLDTILIQLPPSLAFEAGRLDDFLGLLRGKDPNRRYALEFRHDSWLNPEAAGLLSRHNIGCCIPDYGGEFPRYEMITAPFIYVRFHGPGARYASKYNDQEMAAAAEKIREWQKKHDVYVYFNNDSQGFGIENAFTLREMLSPLHAIQAA